MDATANDVPSQYDVKGYAWNYVFKCFARTFLFNFLHTRFPTLYFVPKNLKRNPRKYEGGREVDDFVKFLAKESTDPLKGYNRSGKKTAAKSKTDL